MSEYLTNGGERVKNLLEVFTGIMSGKNAAELIKKHEKAISKVTPYDMLVLTDLQLGTGIKPKEIKDDIEKLINVVYENLRKYEWKKPSENTFLFYLMKENRALELILDQIKKLLIKKDFNANKDRFKLLFNELASIGSHYIKKENILFPYLEKKLAEYRPLSVMWSIHDDIRKTIKKIINMLEIKDTDDMEFNIEVGKVFFLLYGMIQKEELILFPIATEVISDKEWEEMHMQSFEYEFAFIEKPTAPTSRKESTDEYFENSKDEFILKSETGEMTVEQILLIMNKLPIDITFVDENDRVKFFSKPEERFFPRSPAIIGREVKNCHPPESVHIVEKIVDAFKKGEKDTATFWINLKGKFVLIQYYALRNEKGEYKGVLETSQDITEIRSLEGQQRLLDWEE